MTLPELSENEARELLAGAYIEAGSIHNARWARINSAMPNATVRAIREAYALGFRRAGEMAVEAIWSIPGGCLRNGKMVFENAGGWITMIEASQAIRASLGAQGERPPKGSIPPTEAQERVEQNQTDAPEERRNTSEAARILIYGSDNWLKEVAHRDPDMIRDIAAALIYERGKQP